jgi:hypothetical protein
MEAQAWVALILGVMAILSALYAALRYLVKAILAELLPDNNGGHNLRGRVDRIEVKVDRIYELLIESKLSR